MQWLKRVMDGKTARTQNFLGLFGGLWDNGEIDET
jgi:hypothetical protein